MSDVNTPRRQASFVMIDQCSEHSDDMATTSGVASRLPASRTELDSSRNNCSLTNMTPSGEVQMRVTKSATHTMTRPDSPKTLNTENLNFQKLRQELNEHREAERRITGLLESHSDDIHRDEYRGFSNRLNCGGGDSLLNDNRREYLRGRVDQCYGPSTNSPWNAPPNMRAEGCGAVPLDRNWCVDTMTHPDRRYTNVGHGLNNNDMNSRSMFQTNSNTSSHPVPFRTASVTQNKAKKPPTFDGSSSWQDFLVQFEMASAVNNWDEYTKAYELATSLRGVAQGVVTEIEPLRRFDYNYLVSALTSRFEPVNQENMYKVQMNTFHRKLGQTLPEMAQEIRRITRLAYPTAPIDIRNQLAKDCFIRALNEPKIQLSIFQREPKTIDDCIRFGVEYEAFTLEQKRLNTPKQGLRMINETDQLENEYVAHLSKLNDHIEKLTSDSKNNNKSDNLITCYYCSRKGHMKRDCRKLEWDKKHNSVNLGRMGPYKNQSTKCTQETQTEKRVSFSTQENI